MKNHHIAFVLILVVAAFFRFYQLHVVPPSPSLDEVSIGYNAYSIIKTGRDEYGYWFPLLLRAYDDWRPALYVYLTIPFIKLFGLSAFAVRLPSVLMSMLTVVATYFLGKEIVMHKKNQMLSWVNNEIVGLAAMFFLAISPWHIYISRLGHEANLGLTAFVLGLLFFLKAMHQLKQRYFLLWSALCFVFALYGYQSQKVIVPVVLFGLAAIYHKELWQIKKRVVAITIVAAVLLVPFLVVSISPQALIRLKGTSAFSSNNPAYFESAVRVMKAKEQGDLLGQLINNRRLVNVNIFVQNYFSHFSPEWLFTNPNGGDHKVPNMGLLYLLEIPFLLIGLYTFFRYPFSKKTKAFFLLWFFSSPLAAALTTGSPHAMRAYTFLPTWQILSAFGVTFIFFKLRGHSARIAFSSVMALIVFASLLSLFKNYFIVFPKTQSDSFQYALGQSIQYLLKKDKDFDSIVFANNGNLHQSYMFYLFYSMYDPATYQIQGGTKSGGFDESHSFGKYAFRNIDNFENSKQGKTLVVGNADSFPATITPEIMFSNLDEKPVISAGVYEKN